MITITTFGYLHDDAPAADLTLDLRTHFRDPHVSPALRHMTARDAAVCEAVLATPGIIGLLHATAATVRAYLAGPTDAPVRVAVGCAGGRHRAAVVGAALASDLEDGGHRITLTHRDLDKAVVDRTTTPAAQALGPQYAALITAAVTYTKLLHGHGPEALRYDAVINAYTAADWTAIETAERHALEAMVADGIDCSAVVDLGGCGWGSAAISLAARHLIGRSPGWTQEAYDMLTRPWVAAGVGPLHPDDA